MTQSQELISVWGHLHLPHPSPLVRRDSLRPGDRVASSHYGTRSVVISAETRGETTTLTLDIHGSGEVTRSEAYPADSTIPLLERPKRYVALINVPGYLPMDDDPPVFDTPQEAWDYLASERQDGEEQTATEEGPFSGTYQEICDRQISPSVVGTVYGPTPGYDGDHDLGLAYSVQEVKG